MNPPAFPVPMIPSGDGGFYDVQNSGIRTLDWFAAFAMHALLSGPAKMSSAELVGRSYDIAMEMVGERGCRP